MYRTLLYLKLAPIVRHIQMQKHRDTKLTRNQCACTLNARTLLATNLSERIVYTQQSEKIDYFFHFRWMQITLKTAEINTQTNQPTNRLHTPTHSFSLNSIKIIENEKNNDEN